ncbi:MAG: hypothetical protein WBG92_02230 [Thiohalocapsa sp.]
MRADRAAVATKIRALRNKMSLTDDPAVTGLSLSDLLHLMEERDDRVGESVRSLDFQCKWACANIKLNDLLQHLEAVLNNGSPLSSADMIEQSPFEPIYRGATNAKRDQLRYVLMSHFRLIDPFPVELIEIAIDVASNEDDTRTSPLRNRMNAERSKARARRKLS